MWLFLVKSDLVVFYTFPLTVSDFRREGLVTTNPNQFISRDYWMSEIRIDDLWMLLTSCREDRRAAQSYSSVIGGTYYVLLLRSYLILEEGWSLDNILEFFISFYGNFWVGLGCYVGVSTCGGGGGLIASTYFSIIPSEYCTTGSVDPSLITSIYLWRLVEASNIIVFQSIFTNCCWIDSKYWLASAMIPLNSSLCLCSFSQFSTLTICCLLVLNPTIRVSQSLACFNKQMSLLLSGIK